MRTLAQQDPELPQPRKHPFDHHLNRYFSELAQLGSTAELERSSLYQSIRPEVEKVLDSVQVEEFAGDGTGCHPDRVRCTAWNVERGIAWEGIIEQLDTHSILSRSDVLIVTEVDYGMARTRNLNIPREVGSRLGMNYVFAPSYINLEKGSGLEAEVEGENRQALHGNALFSRHPVSEAHSVVLPNGKDKMAGKEKRLGSQRAVAAIVHHPLGEFRAVSAHLDAHSTQKHRMHQMRLILDDLDRWRPELPALIGGDWNTSTYNSRTAFFSIAGYARRVLMGVRHVLKNHYPHPDRWFERHLFRELERRGYRYRDLNEPGGCTLHYDIEDLAANGRMADWIPQWCFWWINWALQKNGGRCSMKLDWFAGKNITPSPRFRPRVVADVHDRESPLSDHDPIVLDFLLGPG